MGRGVAKAWSEQTIIEAGFVADRDLEPVKAKLLIAIRWFYLAISLVALVATTLEALK